MREAPSITIINNLVSKGAKIRAYDPEALEEARHIFSEVEAVSFTETNYDALEGADALLIITEWNEFRQPSFDKVKQNLNQAVIFDGRNIYDPKTMEEEGFTYYSIGRPPVGV